MRRGTPERAEQAAIVELFQTIGARVYTLGTVRKRGDYPGTMQSPGLPDLLVFLPAVSEPVTGATARGLVFVEVKAPRGVLSTAQIEFRAACVEAGIRHVVGGLDAVLEWLEARGYVKAGAR